jgi:hypothetical protein
MPQNRPNAWIVCSAECNICTYKWIAVVEVEPVENPHSTDYKLPENLECPNCEYLNSDYLILDPNQDQ